MAPESTRSGRLSVIVCGLAQKQFAGAATAPDCQGAGAGGRYRAGSWGWLGVWIGRVDVWSMNTVEASSTSTVVYTSFFDAHKRPRTFAD